MTLHKCKKTLQNNALIWKVFNQWRFLDNDRNVKHDHSNGDVIEVCPFCHKALE